MTISLTTIPGNGDTGVDKAVALSLTFGDGVALDYTSLRVSINGVQVLSNVTFIGGYTGSVTHLSGGTVAYVQILTHPDFDRRTIDVEAQITDTGPTTFFVSYSFSVDLPDVSNLRAKSHCGGKRVDLTWTNPSGVAHMQIVRSIMGFCLNNTDPGTTIYDGAPITAFNDGLYVGSVATTNVALLEGQFYYYSIFYTFTPSPTYFYLHTGNCEVEGLSIKDYYAREGWYLYKLLPKRLREKDGDPARGTDQYKVRDYVSVLQCGVNLWRGWSEALVTVSDPENTPAGRLGEAENQTGILEAQVWAFGIVPDKTFDAAILRRVALGMLSVNEEKGTCPGLIDLTKLFATWDSTCDEVIEPRCSIQRVSQWWDNDGNFLQDTHSSLSANNAVVSVAGQVTLTASRIFKADKVTADVLDTVTFAGCMIDALGTFSCITSVAAIGGGTQVVTFTDSSAKMRMEIAGSGTGAANAFTITSINTSSYPWQYPSSGGYSAPTYGNNAFAGLVLMDSTGTTFAITASAATSAGSTALTVVGTPATGTYSIAFAFDPAGATYGTRIPLFQGRLFTGEFSLEADSLWDFRLLHKEETSGPWSMVSGLGSPTIGVYAPTPADVTIWVSNQARALGEATLVGLNTYADSTQAWTVNQWYGYFLLPNWNQNHIFKIIANTATTLIVQAIPGGLSSLSIGNTNAPLPLPIGSRYAILDEANALRYARLVNIMSSFVPIDTRPLLKFVGLHP